MDRRHMPHSLANADTTVAKLSDLEGVGARSLILGARR